jgi:curved DNA-binding protein CbpA
MSCLCAACCDHARTLGLPRWPASKRAVHRAYRSAAKLWHPDRFANDEAKIREAEERFKLLQAAYSELTEHNRGRKPRKKFPGRPLCQSSLRISPANDGKAEPKPPPVPRADTIRPRLRASIPSLSFLPKRKP